MQGRGGGGWGKGQGQTLSLLVVRGGPVQGVKTLEWCPIALLSELWGDGRLVQKRPPLMEILLHPDAHSAPSHTGTMNAWSTICERKQRSPAPLRSGTPHHPSPALQLTRGAGSPATRKSHGPAREAAAEDNHERIWSPENCTARSTTSLAQRLASLCAPGKGLWTSTSDAVTKKVVDITVRQREHHCAAVRQG